MSIEVPATVWEDCVRAVTGCGRENTHISLRYLATIVDDLVGPGRFRKAVELAFQAGQALPPAPADPALYVDPLTRFAAEARDLPTAPSLAGLSTVAVAPGSRLPQPLTASHGHNAVYDPDAHGEKGRCA